MKKLLIAFAALSLLLAACTSKSTPSPQTQASPVAPSSPAEVSPPPTAEKIGDCVIEKKTDCRGDDLKNANLHHAELAGANLKGADLSGADLRHANLRGADLRKANLSGATLDSARMQGASLENANLAGANLAYANMTDARDNGVNTTGTHYCGTIMPDGSTNDANCPGGSTASPKPSATPSSSTKKDGPKITSLSVKKQVDCLKHGSKKKELGVGYVTKYATAWEILVDGTVVVGDAEDGNGNGGEEVIKIKCDAKSHEVTLKVSNDYGETEESATVETGI